MARADADWVGQQLENGRYHVTAVLGAGGMGTVYRARDAKLDAEVVIKVPHPRVLANPRALTRWRREVRALTKLSHANIVKIRDVGDHGDVPYLVMDYLTGGSLHDRMEVGVDGIAQKLPLKGLRAWLVDVADALDYLHGQRLVHRDVKPQNILFDEAGRAHLADFGLIGCMEESNPFQSTEATQAGQLLGTPLYMAPETGQERPDGRLDQYALAVTVYQWLCGQPPFFGPPMIVLTLHATQPVPPPLQFVPDLPEATATALLRGLAKDPAQRFRSCKAFAAAVLAGQRPTQSAPAITPAAHPGETSHRSPAAATEPAAAAPATATRPPEDAASAESSAARSAWLGSLKARRAWIALGIGLLTLVGCVCLLAVSFRGVPTKTNPQTRVTNPKSGVPTTTKPGPQPTNPEPKLDPPKDGYVNGLGMRFAWVPPGKFWMGGGGGKPGGQEVEIPRGFYLGVYEVTQEEWRQVMQGKPNANPSSFSPNGSGKNQVKDISDDDLKRFPVEGVSWNDAQEFLKELNAREQVAGWVYRLPKEAEWEYACRGAPTTREECTYHFYLDRPSNDLSSLQANFMGDKPVGNGVKGPNVARTTKVGSYLPNRLGLHDMHGNVWEWCDNLAGGGPVRVRRGGCWSYDGSGCRAANRFWDGPSNRRYDLGFRLARVPSGE